VKDPVYAARARLASAVHWKNAEAEASARQELAVAHIERAIRRQRDEMSPEQRQRLAALLLNGGE